MLYCYSAAPDEMARADTHCAESDLAWLIHVDVAVARYINAVEAMLSTDGDWPT